MFQFKHPSFVLTDEARQVCQTLKNAIPHMAAANMLKDQRCLQNIRVFFWLRSYQTVCLHSIVHANNDHFENQVTFVGEILINWSWIRNLKCSIKRYWILLDWQRLSNHCFWHCDKRSLIIIKGKKEPLHLFMFQIHLIKGKKT